MTGSSPGRVRATSCRLTRGVRSRRHTSVRRQFAAVPVQLLSAAPIPEGGARSTHGLGSLRRECPVRSDCQSAVDQTGSRRSVGGDDCPACRQVLPGVATEPNPPDLHTRSAASLGAEAPSRPSGGKPRPIHPGHCQLVRNHRDRMDASHVRGRAVAWVDFWRYS